MAGCFMMAACPTCRWPVLDHLRRESAEGNVLLGIDMRLVLLPQVDYRATPYAHRSGAKSLEGWKSYLNLTCYVSAGACHFIESSTGDGE
jgi:hypothetical protein